MILLIIKLLKFFTKYNNLRNQYIYVGKTSFNESELSNIMKEYDSILDMWEQELRDDTKNYLFDDELKLFNRLKYDNKVKNKSWR